MDDYLSPRLGHVVLLLTCFFCTQGLMFPPIDGRSCSDNVDCTSSCCLQIGMRHHRPMGVCQPLGQFGEFCAPGNRLRDHLGSQIYSHSCPCAGGLSCKATWRTSQSGVNVVHDPKCIPDDMHPHFLYVKPIRPTDESLPEVPAQ